MDMFLLCLFTAPIRWLKTMQHNWSIEFWVFATSLRLNLNFRVNTDQLDLLLYNLGTFYIWVQKQKGVPTTKLLPNVTKYKNVV